MVARRPKRGIKSKNRKIVKQKKTVHPVKYRKAVILAKSKLFNRVKKKIKRAKTLKKILIRTKKKKRKIKRFSKSLKQVKKRIKPFIKFKRRIVKKKRIVAKKKRAVKKKVVKKPRKISQSVFPADTLFRAKIKVVGIGGGGGSIVSEIGRSLDKATFIIADTDIRALKKKSGIKYFWFGKEFTHGLGTGVNPEMAKEAAESEKEKITDLFKGQDIVILIASLGGGLGSGATKIFAKAAKSFGGITLGIFTLPFKFEGKNKSKIAQKALKELKSSLNVSITIPNERIFKVIDTDTSITEAFSTINKNLIESLESLIDLIYNPGLINIDFADLRSILNGNGNFAFLNTAQASGKDRAQEIVGKILINPLHQNNNFTAENILFNISGGTNLNMLEVEKISKAIAELNPKAKIIFGISKNVELKNKIRTTILMTGPEKVTKLIKKSIKKTKVAKKVHPPSHKATDGRRKTKNILSNNNFVPIFNKNQVTAETSGKFSIVEPVDIQTKNPSIAKRGTIIRRNALEIKKAEAAEQDKRLLQEEEWEVPAFLRRIKPSTK